MKIHREKLKIAMARACMSTEEHQKAAEMPRPTINNAITGRSVSPKTAGRIARALNVDISELLEVME